MVKAQTCIRQYADQSQINACKKSVKKNDIAFKNLSGLLAMAGNEARLKILFLLEEEGSLCPCDLADILEMSVPAVSQHLRKMKDRAIIETRRDGQTIYYSIVKNQLQLLQPLFKHIVTEKIKVS